DEVQSWKDRDGTYPLPDQKILRLIDDAYDLVGRVDVRREAEGKLDLDLPETEIDI
ncbi:MAG: hypothetical protein QG650_810, partial [Patescibacteria group bacterium]|nr:hypothetical protein [Patescibacteria group bacterium]